MSKKNDLEKSIEELKTKNISYLSIGSEIDQAIEDVLEEAHIFFKLPSFAKEKSIVQQAHSGYRRLGVEYSQALNRPDLNESFSFRKGEKNDMEKRIHPSARNLYIAMEKLAMLYDILAQKILTAIAYSYSNNPQLLITEHNSWLQVNYYKSTHIPGELLQERHDDGHIMTFVFSKKPGLEVFLGGNDIASPVKIIPSTITLMPGEILDLLTDNKISALEHQVRKYSEVTDRLSVMYFINPDVSQRIEPWLTSGSGRKSDIVSKVVKNPLRHGLSSL